MAHIAVEAIVENTAILNHLWELLDQIIEGERERIVARVRCGKMGWSLVKSARVIPIVSWTRTR
ncbi:MAG: hypothetical protein KatS3mg052_2602 [Candidatus Roseilinea sp.]|nr:MAG: hypothetical protein KatS3mg052_2602 [Candidatus Roseilinea sp.]